MIEKERNVFVTTVRPGTSRPAGTLVVALVARSQRGRKRCCGPITSPARMVTPANCIHALDVANDKTVPASSTLQAINNAFQAGDEFGASGAAAVTIRSDTTRLEQLTPRTATAAADCQPGR